MDWSQVEAKWERFSGFAKKQWQKLTDNDLIAIRGKRDSLIQTLTDRYGMTELEAARCADQWLRASQDAETVELRPLA